MDNQLTMDAIASAAPALPQLQVVHAFLDDENTVLVSLTEAIALPIQSDTIAVVSQTSGARYAVAAIDGGHSTYAVLVGDLQTSLGAQGNWYTDDQATRLQKIHSDLYQFRGTLPAGTYHYKIAFNGVFDGAQPEQNIVLQVPADNTEVVFSFVPYDLGAKKTMIYDSINNPDVALPTSSDGISTDLLAITLSDAPAVTDTITVKIGQSEPHRIVPRHVLDDARYTYDGDDLGNTYTWVATAFRVWAPTASNVDLLLYNAETGPLTSKVTMRQAENGTWYARVAKNLKNWYYLYDVTIQGETHTVVDPYVRAIAVNAKRGMIVKLDDTNPSGWQKDRYKMLNNPLDAIIYEVHVRDFSINAQSGMRNKGRYLAFTEQHTVGPKKVKTGIAHLRELGITHAQILPIEEFATVDETASDQYNWGYDPRNYNVPEGAYATTPHGSERISEFKLMVQSLHKAGIGVIMDVVYNHTYESGNSDFDKLVPQYYYRTNEHGYYTNGSGVGNELATERPMVQKFVRDSVKYWTQAYHIDGFRFDLMAPLGVNLMQLIVEDLRAINPSVLLYGEPWTGAGSGLLASQLLVKARQKGLGVGVFNDNIRNAINGPVFDARTRGFATGEPGQVDAIKRAIAGSIDDFASTPGETINYVTSHDNYALWDKITLNSPEVSEADRIKMDELAQAIVLTSQGVAFLQGGEEFLRTKGGNENSYNAGDAVNQFDWQRKAQYRAVVDYYAGLIHLRRNHPAFRLPSAEAIRQHLVFLDSPENSVAFALLDHANGDAWQHIIVIYNPNMLELSVNLPAGAWAIVATQGQAGEQELARATTTVSVPPLTCMILHNV